MIAILALGRDIGGGGHVFCVVVVYGEHTQEVRKWESFHGRKCYQTQISVSRAGQVEL